MSAFVEFERLCESSVPIAIGNIYADHPALSDNEIIPELPNCIARVHKSHRASYLDTLGHLIFAHDSPDP